MNFAELAAHPEASGVVEHSGEDALERAEVLCSYLKKKAEAEEAHALGLEKLKKLQSAKKDASFGSTLLGHLLEFDLAGARTVHSLSKEIVAQTVQRMKEASKLYRREREAQQQEIRVASKKWSKTYGAVEKLQKKAEAFGKEAEAAKKTFDRADQDMHVTKAYVQKTHNDFKAKEAEALRAQSDYQAAAEKIQEEYQQHHLEILPELLSTLQQIDEKFLETEKVVLLDYVALLDAAQHSRAQELAAFAQAIEATSIEAETRRIVGQFVADKNEHEAVPFTQAPRRAETLVRVLYDFVPESGAEELQISAGETLRILEKGNGWWLAQNSSGAQGFVPENYLEE